RLGVEAHPSFGLLGILDRPGQTFDERERGVLVLQVYGIDLLVHHVRRTKLRAHAVERDNDSRHSDSISRKPGFTASDLQRTWHEGHVRDADATPSRRVRTGSSGTLRGTTWGC